LEKLRLGRPIGSTSWKTRLAQDFSRNILLSDEYRRSLAERVRNGTLHHDIEKLLWAYAWGKPQENVHVTVAPTDELLATTPTSELVARAEVLLDDLRE